MSIRALTRAPSARALCLGVALACLFTVAVPKQAHADGSQLCRAGMNLALFPFDIVLSPFITAKDMYYGLTEIGDEVLIQIVATVPGYFYLNTVQVGGGIIRGLAGIYEIPPGLFTLFREGDSGALYRSQDETWQMVNKDFGPCPFRFGSSYNTINEG